MRDAVHLPSRIGHGRPAVHGRVVATLRVLAFWLAVAMPPVYAPGLVFYATGDLPAAALGGLVCAHAGALRLGHPYKRPTADGGPPGAAPSADGR